MAHRVAQEQAAERAPPAAAPTTQAAAEVAAEFGATEMDAASKGGEEAPAVGGAVGGAGRLRRHHAPPPAGPAAAAEPAIGPDPPSVPSAERTAATTRGGAGVEAAAHGFAAEVPADLLEELPAVLEPPQARNHSGVGGGRGWEAGCVPTSGEEQL